MKIIWRVIGFCVFVAFMVAGVSVILTTALAR